MSPRTLLGLLEQAARHPAESGITFYAPGNVAKVSMRLTYHELLQQSRTNASLFRRIPYIMPDTVFLLHFDNHLDGIEFFWSTVAAGYVPAINTPFTNDVEQRRKHLGHLQTLLRNPIIVTRQRLLSEFADLQEQLNIWTIEEIQSQKSLHSAPNRTTSTRQGDDIAVLMLTSGSTGNAKAVGLRHRQVLEAVKGKATHHGTRSSDVFLNWIGLDHVANLTEIHLHAMSLAAEQIHAHAADMIAEPVAFIKLLDRHRAAYTFAPNFFLASLRKALEKPECLQLLRNIDLCCLRAFVSGGEANVTETCDAITRLLRRLGAPTSFVRPGFGMTETCAGSIYNTKCPRYDLIRGTEFTSLGSAIPGLHLRITRDDRSLAGVDEVGNLEVSGPVVFTEYYNNPTATAEAFSPDGWFITGDKAFLDIGGQLSLSGRVKESIIINGVKHFPHEIESAIEDAAIYGITPSYTAIFPHRPQGSPTEVLCVVYLPAYDREDAAIRVAVRRSISDIAVRQTGARPFRVLPLSKEVLPKTTLGKLSRAKIRTAFEAGAFAAYEAIDDSFVRGWQRTHDQKPTSEIEKTLFGVYLQVLEVTESDIDIDTSVFEMGISSVEMLRLKSAVEIALALQTAITITTIMAHPTIRSLAAFLARKTPNQYNPAVVLHATGQRTPLWLVHPGVGEILIFLHLTKHVTDRPVYAFRSRGFDGEPYFQSIKECVSTYHATMKRFQPTGPYALLGYSYGGTLAFELGKTLQIAGDEVKFLGVIDQPPNIRMRMRHSDWPNVALTLAQFLEIIDDGYAAKIYPSMCKLSHDQILDHILSRTTAKHLEQMAINKQKLGNWATLALNNHAIARDYEPQGKVQTMDVFFASKPDAFYAESADEMLENCIRKWEDFVDSKPEYHRVLGTHNDMIRPVHVAGFYKALREAMELKGL